jgi:hypothetical protein
MYFIKLSAYKGNGGKDGKIDFIGVGPFDGV